jgi:hypothetical protein
MPPEAVNASLIPFPIADKPAPAARASGYEAVRFNAMKHGLLSRLAVLPHEDGAEFTDLLAALSEEYRPAGITERHLIEELAAFIWRKRRVLLVEGARINRVCAVSPIASRTARFRRRRPSTLDYRARTPTCPAF